MRENHKKNVFYLRSDNDYIYGISSFSVFGIFVLFLIISPWSLIYYSKL